MGTERTTASLDENARDALDDLTNRTGRGQSELVRKALRFYAANYWTATTEAGTKLEDYHEMLSGGEHVLLDVDFLRCFLDYVTDEEGTPDPAFLEGGRCRLRLPRRGARVTRRAAGVALAVWLPGRAPERRQPLPRRLPFRADTLVHDPVHRALGRPTALRYRDRIRVDEGAYHRTPGVAAPSRPGGVRPVTRETTVRSSPYYDFISAVCHLLRGTNR